MIAHFVTEFNKNGTSRFVYLVEELSEHHNVELITSNFSHIKNKKEKQKNTI